MLLFDLLGADPLTGMSIPDAVFDVNNPSFRYSLHHMSKNSKMSLALYEQLLTIQTQGIHAAYESMSELNQFFLKQGLRELIMTGITRSESSIKTSAPGFYGNVDYLYSGTGVKQWITFEDFKTIFPNTLQFTFNLCGGHAPLLMYSL